MLEVGYSTTKKAKFIFYRYNSVGVLKTNQSYNFIYIRLDNGFAKIMKIGKYQEKNEYRKIEFKAYYSDEHIKGYHLIVEEKDGIVMKYTKCKIDECGDKLAYHGNTSSMLHHVKHKHNNHYK